MKNFGAPSSRVPVRQNAGRKPNGREFSYFVELDDMNLNYLVECMPGTDHCGFITISLRHALLH